MSQAIVDPNDLRKFARTLERFSAELQDQMLMLKGQLNALGETWRDQEHDKFVQEFEFALAAIHRFQESAETHVPFLLRKAAKIEDYLRQR